MTATVLATAPKSSVTGNPATLKPLTLTHAPFMLNAKQAILGKPTISLSDLVQQMTFLPIGQCSPVDYMMLNFLLGKYGQAQA